MIVIVNTVRVFPIICSQLQNVSNLDTKSKLKLLVCFFFATQAARACY